MATKTIGSKIVMDGEKEYRQSLANIGKELGTMKSEMKLLNTTYSDNANSLEALRKKQEVLEKSYTTQLKKVLTLEEALDQAKETYGENSTQVQDWMKKLYDAESQLTKLDKELTTNSKYLDEADNSADKCAISIDSMGKKVKTAGNDMDSAKTKASLFGDVLKGTLASEVILNGARKLAEGVKKITSSLFEAVTGAASYADEIITMSNNTGIAKDTLQELYYMQELTDVSLDTVTSTMEKNIKSMYNAQKGLTDNIAAYNKLGISVTDSNGNLRDSETVYWEAIDALGNMTNETERDATAMVLFGKSAQDLNSVIKLGSKGVEEYAREAQEMGAVLSDDVLSTLGETDDAFQRMQQQIEITKRGIGIAFAPSITEGAERLTDAVTDLGDEFADTADELVDGIVDGMIWIIDNADYVIAGVKGIASGFIAFKVASSITTIISSIQSMQIAIRGVTAATYSMNAAMASNPYTAIAAAVGLLIGGLVTLTSVMKDHKSATDLAIESENEYQEAIMQSAESYNEMVASKAESAGSEIAVLERAKALSDELLNLADASGVVNEADKTRAQYILNELNTALGTEFSMTGNQIQGYNNLISTIDNLIISKTNLILFEAQESMLKEALLNQKQTEIDLIKKSTEVAIQEKKTLEAKQEYEKAYSEWINNKNVLEAEGFKAKKNATLDAWESEKSILDEKKTSYSELQDNQKTYNDTIQAYEDASTANLEGNKEKANQILQNYLSNYEYTEDGIVNSNSAITDSTKAFLSTALQDTSLTTDEIEKIINNLPDGLTLDQAMEDIGRNSASSMGVGFELKWYTAKSKIETLVSNLPTSVKKLLGIASPSRVFKKIGTDTGEGYEYGAIESLTKAKSSIDSLIKDQVDSISGNYSAGNVNYSINGNSEMKLALNEVMSKMNDQKMIFEIPVILEGRQIAFLMTEFSKKRAIMESEG